MNKKVRHDVTDKNYPNFDVFQDIQSQNNFSNTQLNIMGYKGDAIKSQFTDNTIRERQASMTVMASQTCKRQEAIAATNTSMSPQTTGSKQQKSIGGMQRLRRWRMTRRARWNITSDAKPHCPFLSAW
jgi:hypothetical protein